MKSVFSLLVVLVLTGCGSTPYRDDYTIHTNLVGKKFKQHKALAISFSEGDGIDLRGIHFSNDEVENSSILYAGQAGIIGLLAQIGTHASIVNSSRNNKLAMAQEQANSQVNPLIEQAKHFSLKSLLAGYEVELVDVENETLDTVRLRPIFFSNAEMNQLMIKLVAWIPNAKGRKKEFIYQNMIQVFSPVYDGAEREQLLMNADAMLFNKLSSLLKTAVNIASNDIRGMYKNVKKQQQTFFIKRNETRKVVRGAIVEQNCEYKVIQDLHSWFIAIPIEAEESLVTCKI